jgi:hypothetical protein
MSPNVLAAITTLRSASFFFEKARQLRNPTYRFAFYFRHANSVSWLRP